MSYLQALWAKLITREKELFKSATLYFAAALAAAPEVLAAAQDQWPSIAPYLPHVLQDSGLKWIAIGVFLCRIRSMIKISKG